MKTASNDTTLSNVLISVKVLESIAGGFFLEKSYRKSSTNSSFVCCISLSSKWTENCGVKFFSLNAKSFFLKAGVNGNFLTEAI